jgi:succinate dehydrogenase / fumarate reductase, cytochrome b subunit
MALTGAIMVGFVVGHMAGNLKMFAGCDVTSTGPVCKIDHYAEFLRAFGSDLFGHSGFLWFVRVVLFIVAILHIDSAIKLSLLSRKAKGGSYAVTNYRSSTIASRTMRIGGIVLALFIVLHILHFTTGTIHYSGFVEGNVYDNVTRSFTSPLIVALYVIAMTALCLHLYHGTWSMFQTIGVDNASWNKTLRTVAKITSVIVYIGFISVPLAIYLGFIPLRAM